MCTHRGFLCRLRFRSRPFERSGFCALLGLESGLRQQHRVAFSFGVALRGIFQLALGCLAALGGFSRLGIGFSTQRCSELCLLLRLRARCSVSRSLNVCRAALQRRRFGSPVGFQALLRELQRLGVGECPPLRLGLCFELYGFACTGFVERVRVCLSPRLCRRLGGAVGFDARLCLLLQLGFGLRTLACGLQRALFFGFVCARRCFGALLGFEPGLGVFACTAFCLGTTMGLAGQCGFGFGAPVGQCCELALGFSACLCCSRSLRFGALSLAQGLFGAGLGCAALACGLFRVTLGLRTRNGFFCRLGFCDRARLCCGFRLLFGFEQRLCDAASFCFRLRSQLRLSIGFALCDFTCRSGFTCLRICLRALVRRGFGGTVRLETSDRLLLELGLGALASAGGLQRLLFGCCTCPGGFHGARFSGGLGSGDRFGAALGLDARDRVTLQIRFRRGTRHFGFERVLLCRGTPPGGFGSTRFRGGARLGHRFSRAIGFSACGRLLLGFRFGGEAGVRGFDGLLVGPRACLGGGLRFDFRLFACLRLFDGA